MEKKSADVVIDKHAAPVSASGTSGTSGTSGESRNGDTNAIIRKVGSLLFIVGVLVAATFASRGMVLPEGASSAQKLAEWWSAAGVPFSVGMVLLVAGAFLARRRGATDGEAAPTSLRHPRGPIAMLAAMRARLDGLQGLDAEKDAEALSESLDVLLEEEVPAFVNCRQQLIVEMGLGNFAEMIGQFSTMERNAARAWSALTDEFYPEVPGCLERAHVAAEHAAELLVLPADVTEPSGEVATGAAT